VLRPCGRRGHHAILPPSNKVHVFCSGANGKTRGLQTRCRAQSDVEGGYPPSPASQPQRLRGILSAQDRLRKCSGTRRRGGGGGGDSGYASVVITGRENESRPHCRFQINIECRNSYTQVRPLPSDTEEHRRDEIIGPAAAQYQVSDDMGNWPCSSVLGLESRLLIGGRRGPTGNQ
jgi:hypothetical protein